MKVKRRCRICGKPEKKYVAGYTNLSPYSEICVDCMNAAFEKADKAKAAVLHMEARKGR